MTMRLVEVFVGLLIFAVPLVGLARRWNVPYPIVLVLGGLAAGFVPGLPAIELDPNLVLLIFLPPLLYWESVTAPTDEMRTNARLIWPLAVGLVIVTISGVAWVAHLLVPQMGWAAAFVLGAVVAPTDEIASVPIAERLGVPRHVIAIIDGESLLNDAGSLVIYVAAVAAVVTGTFSWAHASLQFVLAAAGAFVIGVAAGALAVCAWRFLRDTRLQAVISVLTPFLAWIPAQQFGFSGVLAVVTAGVFVNRFTPLVLTPSARLQAVGFWETTVFLANAVIFILLGMQLHTVARSAVAHGHPWSQLLLVAFAVNVAVIALRFAWVLAQTAAIRTPSHADRDWKHFVVIALAGFRGAVSLAAALAIPATIASGAQFPERDLIVFVTFSVILVTLIGGGLSLPWIIRALRIPADDTEEDELRAALRAMSEAALRRIAELVSEGRVDPEYARHLQHRYETRRVLYAAAADAEKRLALRRYAVECELLQVERETLIRMRKDGEIENKVQRRVLLTLDMEETELQRFAADVQGARGAESELDTAEPPSGDVPPESSVARVRRR